MDPLSQPVQSKNKTLLPLVAALILILIGLWWLWQRPDRPSTGEPLIKTTAPAGGIVRGFPPELIPRGAKITSSKHYGGTLASGGKDLWVTQFTTPTPTPASVLVKYYTDTIFKSAGYAVTGVSSDPEQQKWTIKASKGSALVTLIIHYIEGPDPTIDSVFISYE